MRKRKVVEDKREKEDPYYAMLKREEPIESRYIDHFDIDDDEVHRYWDQVERNIGRYPEGFRHYENFESYRIANPNATLQDYHSDSKLNNIRLTVFYSEQTG